MLDSKGPSKTAYAFPCALVRALAAADSYGCILGKSTPLQLVVLTVMESVFFQVCTTADAGRTCEMLSRSCYHLLPSGRRHLAKNQS